MLGCRETEARNEARNDAYKSVLKSHRDFLVTFDDFLSSITLVKRRIRRVIA